MRAVVQRVSRAQVSIEGRVVGRVGRGLCVLVGVTHDDDDDVARRLAARLWALRVFPDEAGVMNVAARDAGAELLVISQFTLYGDTRKGNRPSFVAAAPGAVAEPLVAEMVAELGRLGARVATGRFGADMQVELVNDGPVTVTVEVSARRP